MIRPNIKSVIEVRDVRSAIYLLGFVLNSVQNELMLWHNFESVSSISACNSGIKDDENFLLHSPTYDQMRNNLPDQLSEFLGFELKD